MSSVKSIYNLLNFGVLVHNFLIPLELRSSSEVKFIKKQMIGSSLVFYFPQLLTLLFVHSLNVFHQVDSTRFC